MFYSNLFLNLKSVISVSGTLPDTSIPLKLSTDSRSLSGEQVYLCLDGDNFKGIQFAEEAILKFCSIIVWKSSSHNDEVIHQLKDKYDSRSIVFIEVKCTIEFLHELAKARLIEWKAIPVQHNDFSFKNKKVIAITGSNGKTSTKEIIFHLIHSLNPKIICSTYKNLNNHIGVPKTILELENEQDILLVEMGVNHPGEMDVLLSIADPTIGVVTNIGESHLQFFKDKNGVFQEKRKLYDQVVIKNSKEDPIFILNLDDEYLKQLSVTKGVSTFREVSSNFKNDEVCFTFEGSYLNLYCDGITIKIENDSLVGKHNFINLLVSFMLVNLLFPNKRDQILKSIKEYKPLTNRSSWKILKKSPHNISNESDERRVYLDAYNANPSSMRSSLNGVIEYFIKKGIDLSKVLFILGDMNELGENSSNSHYEIGSLIANFSIKNVVFIGRYSIDYLNGYKSFATDLQNVILADSKDDFMEESWSILREKYNYFFVKASRSLALEDLFKDS